MIKKELQEALLTIEKEKKISKEVLIYAIKEAICNVYNKMVSSEVKPLVEIDPKSFDIRIVVGNRECSLEDLGRGQVASIKQAFLHRLKEASVDVMYMEFKDRIGDIMIGTVRSISRNAVYVELNKLEGILPYSERIPTEFYSIGMKARFYILDVRRQYENIQVILSRATPEFVRRLFELEVPEITEGIVKIEGIAREPGFRCKVAVSSKNPNIDAVGACIGAKGMRIQSITNELRGEKIDVVRYYTSPQEFIKHALLPAHVQEIEIKKDRYAVVYVDKSQLSLAIGKDGQNVRLAVKLTGWNIDVKAK